MMTSRTDKPSRAELVRQRRRQDQKRRYQAVTREATSARPIISHPRRWGGQGARPLRKTRGFNIALGDQTLPLSVDALAPIVGSWRMMSLTLIVLLVGLLAKLLTDRSMYVTAINLGGAALVPSEEIFAGTGVAGSHIFWVDPAEVQKNVAEIPGIATAKVSVEWPAKMTVLVVERVPKLSLVEGEKTWWVDAAGQKFASRGALPGVLPILSESGSTLSALPPEAVQGALQLKQLRSNIEKLYYDPAHGLSYQDGRGWRGYFGVGLEMSQKLAVYEELIDNLLQQGISPRLISVESLRTPYYKK
jgi:cell division septal protein FtsQ